MSMKEYKPYVYKMTLKKGDQVFFYVGSRSSKHYRVNPQEFLDGHYNSSSKEVHKLLEDGYKCSREVLYTYEGTTQGAIECSKKEGEILVGVKAKQSDQWLNKNNSGASIYNHTKEYKMKKSEALKGRKLSEETRKKMSDVRRGRALGPQSEETKKKRSEALKRVWAMKKKNLENK